ncbi:hypothetical protein PG984_011204 [Apiospora sp. TS-2023a]
MEREPTWEDLYSLLDENHRLMSTNPLMLRIYEAQWKDLKDGIQKLHQQQHEDGRWEHLSKLKRQKRDTLCTLKSRLTLWAWVLPMIMGYFPWLPLSTVEFLTTAFFEHYELIANCITPLINWLTLSIPALPPG